LSDPRLSTGSRQLFSKTLELHQIVEALLRRPTQVLPQQRAIDVFLVGLDHRIRLEPEPPEDHRAVDL
jgi:hypothetical protein